MKKIHLTETFKRRKLIRATKNSSYVQRAFISYRRWDTSFAVVNKASRRFLTLVLVLREDAYHQCRDAVASFRSLFFTAGLRALSHRQINANVGERVAYVVHR